MAIQVALHHSTRYRYDRRVSLSPHIVRLRPAPHCRTPILAYSLKVLPANHFINWQQDPQANYLARLVFPEPTTELFVEVDLVAEMAVFNPFDFFLEPYAEQYPFTYETSLPVICARSSKPSLPVPGSAAFLARVPRASRPHHGLSGRPQSTRAERNRLCHPHGARRADLRGDAHAAQRLLPRFGLAAGADPAPPGAGGALCFRLPDSTRGRREAARWTGRSHRRLHRSARLDRSVSAGRRLDRIRSHFRAAGRRRTHPARLHARRFERRADLRPARSLQDRVHARDDRASGFTNPRASPSPTPTNSGRL